MTNKILEYHNDIVEFIYKEMDGKLYCDQLYINDLLEKEIILPNYSVPYDMIVKWYETYHAMMKFLQYNNYAKYDDIK